MRKKSMKRWVKAALAAGVCLFVAGNGFALSYVWNVAEGNWADPASWNLNNGMIPGSGDIAFVRNNSTATIDSNVGSINYFYLGEVGASGTITITNNGSLTTLYTGTASRPSVGRPLAGGATGYLNLSGGTLNIHADGSEVLNIGVNTASAQATGLFTISGGTFNGRMLVGSDIAGDSGDRLRIVGDAATIGSAFNDGGAGVSLEVRASGTLEFIFDSTGISTMNFADTVTFSSGSTVIIDGAAYTGGVSTFNLITSPILGAKNATVSLINFAEGTTYDWNTTTDTLSVTTAIPEPATIGMLGLGAIAVLAVRRYARK